MSVVGLYQRVYPEHDGADLHWFMRAHGIGICIDDADRERNRRGQEEARRFLARRLWEKQTGETLDAAPA